MNSNDFIGAIIDIRNPVLYRYGHIKGAINIEGNLLVNFPEKYINKDNNYYVYCDYGYKSKKCASILQSKGYKVYNIDGGYNEYKKSIK